MRIFLYLLVCILDALGASVGLGLEGSVIGIILCVVIIVSWINLLVKIEEKTDYNRWICVILTTLALFFIIAVIFVILVLIEWIFW